MAVIVREKKKGSGEWWLFINHQGKRRSKKIGDKRAANRVAREIRVRLVQGDMGILKAKTPTIAKYGEQWLYSAFHEWADGTRDNYGSAFTHHIEPALGERRLDEVGRKEVKAFIGTLKRKDLSKGRIELIVQTLRNIFNEAIDDQLLTANPCDRVGKYNKGRRKGEINPLTADEVTAMLENAHKALSFTLYALFLLSVMSGLRIGEILALEWNDFDLDERTVDVTKNWDYIRNKMGPPKNNKPRKVDLPPVVVDTMRELRAKQKVVTLKEVFVDDNGKRLKHKPVYRALHKIAPRKIRIHDLRHTYATLRVAKGDNIVDVSNQLGHHKVGFTLDRYAKWMPGEHKSQVDELGNLAPKRTLSVFVETTRLQFVSVYAKLHNQKVPDVKAEITFGHVFPGRFEAIFAGGEIPKTTNTFTKKGGQEGIIVLGESSADMVTSYGKTRTESRDIVSI